MKNYTSEQIRNIAFLGHSGSGKSTLGEAMLFSHKHVDRMGKAEEHTLTADFDPEEKSRGMSINSSILPVETKDAKINIIDCPGNRDFIGEVLAATRVSEGVLLFLDATSGVEVGTEMAMERAEELELPVAAYVTKLDKENTDFKKTCDQITEMLDRKAVPFTLPIGTGDDISGVVDLTRKKAVTEVDGKVTMGDIPADMQETVDSFNEVIVEAAAEGDDELMEKFFEKGELTDEEISIGLHKAFLAGTFIPVFCGIPTKGVGVEPITHFIEASFPSPLEERGLEIKGSDEFQQVDPEGGFSAFVFKTLSDDFAGRLNFFKVMTGKFTTSTPLYNITQDHSEKIAHLMAPRGKKQEEVDELVAGDIGVVSKLSHTQTNDTLAEPKTEKQYAATTYPQRTTFIAIHAADSKDEDKIGVGIHTIIEQDPTLHIERDAEVHQTILSGMGEQHIDVAIARLKAKTKVDVVLEAPKVRYRETITKKAEGSYRHKKQSGGRGQFAEVHIRLEPCKDEEYKFTWSVFGGAIPTNFQSAIDRGAQMAMEKGILAGCRVVNVAVDCFDGKHHPVDSSDMAFQLATSQAFKQVTLKANPIILEPICDVTTTVPEANMGDVMGDVSQRRGRIQGSEAKGKKVVVKAQVPEGEMQTYAQQLRSMTGGRGVFEREFSHYEPVPGDVQKKIIEDAAKPEEEEA